VWSGRGLCDVMITSLECPTEYGVSECDREAAVMNANITYI